MENILCPYCAGTTIKFGNRFLKSGYIQRYKCKACGRVFSAGSGETAMPASNASDKDQTMVSPDQYVEQVIRVLKKFPLITDIQYNNPFHGKQQECAVLLLSDSQTG